jgi:phosphoadenosine phosphosulfate reductase
VTLESRIERARALLAEVAGNHPDAVFACSFGAEDMVLIDLIARARLAIRPFMIDTGRLPEETLDLLEATRQRYGLAVDVYHPKPDAVRAYVAQRGADAFYESVEARKACCGIRKVEPLRRALSGRSAWVTGLRREQSDSRAEVAESAHDESHGLLKVNPLADWTEADVWAYLRRNEVPYSALHDRGYPSIGCEPCTRAVKPGEHPRAGRWWWERDGAKKECGLHEVQLRVLSAAT